MRADRRGSWGAETVVIPECGHYLVIEEPEAAARHVLDFVLAP